MEIKNNQNTVIITEETTLGELLAILGSITKAEKIPSAKKLREEAGEPIAVADGCLVYGNGYAVYDNGSGRTVIWLPDCTAFTYRFNKLKDSEQGGDLKETEALPEGFLERQPQMIPVTLIGEHRIENRSFHRKSDRQESKSLIRGDNEEGDALEEQGEREDSLRKEYSWREEQFGENPETTYIRKETQEEMLAAMTDKQREVFLLYYRDGFTQQQIAEKVNVSQVGVKHHLDGALKKIKKLF